MSDLFNEVLEDSGSSELPAPNERMTDNVLSSSAAKAGSSKSADASHSSKRDSRDKDKKSSSKSSTHESINRLSEIMIDGFQSLQQMFEGYMVPQEEDYDAPIESIDDYRDATTGQENDLFQEVSMAYQPGEKRGAEVVPSLAALANGLLKKNIELSDKDKFEKYLIPSNVEYVDTPLINKPIWGTLSHESKRNDVALQTIQKKFLHGSLPILDVMQKLNASQDDLNALDAKQLVQKLSDSLAFIGSANTSMVQYRRNCLKKDIPQSMHPLCADSVSFSGKNLFGNDLSGDIKEVSELNKMSQQFRTISRPFRGRVFRGVSRGQRTFLPRFRGRGRGRITKRLPSAASLPGRRSLNSRGPTTF